MKIVAKTKKYGIIDVTKETIGEIMSSIGARIRSLREYKEWSQEDLARESGLKRPHISLMENNERTPGADSLIKLAAALETSTDYLLGRTDDSNPRPPPNHPSFATREFREIQDAWAYLSSIDSERDLAIIHDTATLLAEKVRLLKAREIED